LGQRPVFSVAVRGYGIVIWDDDGRWRTFGANESMSATLAARVELALDSLPIGTSDQDEVCSALLSISGAHLLSVECDHGAGECPGDDFRN
jgi:hypothetical protein